MQQLQVIAQKIRNNQPLTEGEANIRDDIRTIAQNLSEEEVGLEKQLEEHFLRILQSGASCPEDTPPEAPDVL